MAKPSQQNILSLCGKKKNPNSSWRNYTELTYLIDIAEHLPPPYLPSSTVLVTPFQLCCGSSVDAVAVACLGLLNTTKPGLLGSGSGNVSLDSIMATVAMAGLTAARSCTHSSATCMHLSTSDTGQVPLGASSSSSTHLPSFHSPHA